MQLETIVFKRRINRFVRRKRWRTFAYAKLRFFSPICIAVERRYDCLLLKQLTISRRQDGKKTNNSIYMSPEKWVLINGLYSKALWLAASYPL